MQGFRYPLTTTNGSVEVTDELPKLVSGAILSSILTLQEERVFRPEYGRDEQVFDSINSLVDLLGNLRKAIATGLEGYPEIRYELLGSIGDDGKAYIQVLYTCPDELERTIEVAL